MSSLLCIEILPCLQGRHNFCYPSSTFPIVLLSHLKQALNSALDGSKIKGIIKLEQWAFCRGMAIKNLWALTPIFFAFSCSLLHLFIQTSCNMIKMVACGHWCSSYPLLIEISLVLLPTFELIVSFSRGVLSELRRLLPVAKQRAGQL